MCFPLALVQLKKEFFEITFLHVFPTSATPVKK